MKNLSMKVVLAFIAAFFLFSCSNEDNFMDQTSLDAESTLSADEEAAAYQDLFVQLNELKQKYDVEPQTRIVGGDVWLDKTFRVVSAGVSGEAIAFRKTMFEKVATAIAASLRATPFVSNIHPHAEDWTGNKMSDLYLSAIGMSASDFDKAGDGYNRVIGNLYRNGPDWTKMTDAQLQSAIVLQLPSCGFLRPPSYNSMTFILNFAQINYLIQRNNYDIFMQDLVFNKIISNNEYNLALDFLNGLSRVTKSNALRYCSDYRNTVYYSSIPSDAKTNICSIVSIGYASANLWCYSMICTN